MVSAKIGNIRPASHDIGTRVRDFSDFTLEPPSKREASRSEGELLSKSWRKPASGAPQASPTDVTAARDTSHRLPAGHGEQYSPFFGDRCTEAATGDELIWRGAVRP